MVVRTSPSFRFLFLLALALAGAAAPTRASGQETVVRALLFYAPTCPHCTKVMTEDLAPLAQRYGDRLVVVGVDVTAGDGATLLRAAVDHFGVPEGDVGVPFMVVGDSYLMGAVDIPARLPGIVDRALADQGVDWPPVQALRDALEQQGLLEEAPARATTAASSEDG